MKLSLKKTDMLDLSWRLWTCLLLIVTMVGVVLYFQGFDIWMILLICIALICPAVVLWGISLAAGDAKHGGNKSADEKRR